MLTIEKMQLAVLMAIELGINELPDLREFLDLIGADETVRVIGSGQDREIATIANDGVIKCFLTNLGEVALIELKERHTPDEIEIINYQIALLKERYKTQAVERELAEKKAIIESGIISFDRRLNDARNLIECYEGMANKVEKNRDATLTIFENIEPFLGDADALYTIVTQIAHIWENTTTDPTAYDPIPF